MKRQPSVPSYIWCYEDGLASGTTYPRHTHEVWELLLVASGTMRVCTGDKEGKGVVGSIFIRPPGTPHQEWCISKERLRTKLLFWAFPRGYHVALPTETFDATGNILKALCWMEHIHFYYSLQGPLMDSILQTVLMDCSNLPRTVEPNRIAKVVQHVERNLIRPFTVEQMAEIAGMSRTIFAMKFLQQTGMTPMGYLRKVRLDYACRQLRTTNKVLRAIALESGFRDEYAFSRVFRRVIGMSPSSMRRQHLTKNGE